MYSICFIFKCFQNKFWCSQICSVRDFCSAWWIEDGKCIITNFQISAGLTSGSHRVYTNKISGNKIVGAIGTSTEVSENRFPLLASRGIFTYASKTGCVVASRNPEAWIAYDLQKLTTISEIYLRTQTYYYIQHMPTNNTRILLGNTYENNGDFSQFEIVGTLILTMLK